MAFKIIKIGKVKNKNIASLCDYYKTLIGRYKKIEVVQLNTSNKKTRELIRKDEGIKISKSVDDDSFNILLDEKGKNLSTLEFANLLDEKISYGKSVNFFIAGTFGIDDSYKKNFDLRLSLSKMTFPHELAYLLLLEQLFRTMKIFNNEPYDY